MIQQLPELNLPAFNFKTRESEVGTLIWDLVRKKYVTLTPEEWVRQHFIVLLTVHLKYPASLFKIESGVIYNKRQKRTDIEILDRRGEIFMLIECKRPEVKLDDATVRQLTIYNQTLQAPYLALTNGKKHFIWKKNDTKREYVQIEAFPDYN